MRKLSGMYLCCCFVSQNVRLFFFATLYKTIAQQQIIWSSGQQWFSSMSFKLYIISHLYLVFKYLCEKAPHNHFLFLYSQVIHLYIQTSKRYKWNIIQDLEIRFKNLRLQNHVSQKGHLGKFTHWQGRKRNWKKETDTVCCLNVLLILPVKRCRCYQEQQHMLKDFGFFVPCDSSISYLIWAHHSKVVQDVRIYFTFVPYIRLISAW